MKLAHEAIANLLATGEDYAELVASLEVSRYESVGFPDLFPQVRARSVIGFWYAETKAEKRKGFEKQKWQRIEDVLEAALIALNSGLIATQNTNNHTERFSGNS
jgi:hypothetical protein